MSAGARGSHIGSSGIPWNSHPPWLCCNTVSSSVAELDTRAGSEVSSSCYTAHGTLIQHYVMKLWTQCIAMQQITLPFHLGNMREAGRGGHLPVGQRQRVEHLAVGVH